MTDPESGTDPDYGADGGLQAERTDLSWSRTSIAIIVNGLLIVFGPDARLWSDFSGFRSTQRITGAYLWQYTSDATLDDLYWSATPVPEPGTLALALLGLASIAADVSPELARATIESVTVLGAFQASAAVKATLADRMG